MSGYTAEQCESFREKIVELRNAQLLVLTDMADIAQRLTCQQARTFANEGLGRRLRVIERCILNVFAIFPPDRAEFLTKEDCDNVAIQLHAFAVNVYALFDNVAWVCTLEAGLNISPLDVGPYKKACRPAIPAALQRYLDEITAVEWFSKYGKGYRDSTAHRIPPYLPPRALTAEDAARWQQLHNASMDALLGLQTDADRQDFSRRLALHESLEEQKGALGSNSLVMAISLTGSEEPLVYMHPQLLCDWALAHELLQTFSSALRGERGWPAAELPPLEVVDEPLAMAARIRAWIQVSDAA